MTDNPDQMNNNRLLADDRDEFLGTLVVLANAGVNAGITLYVGGSIISGTLISGGQYFKEFGSQFLANLPNDDLRDATAPYFELQAGLYDKSQLEEGQSAPRDYIHLSNARWHHPAGNIPSNGGVLWRGRLSAVDGFNLGTMVSAQL